jgi:hypothetical protein
VNGFAYVTSLFFQTALGITPSRVAIGLAPVMIGIVGASLVCRLLIINLGRRLVVIGLLITLAGAGGLWDGGLEGISVDARATGCPWTRPRLDRRRCCRRGIAALCLGLVWLLPRDAPSEENPGT